MLVLGVLGQEHDRGALRLPDSHERGDEAGARRREDGDAIAFQRCASGKQGARDAGRVRVHVGRGRHAARVTDVRAAARCV